MNAMASQAKLRAESFQDLWQILSKPLATPEERAAVYLTLAKSVRWYTSTLFVPITVRVATDTITSLWYS